MKNALFYRPANLQKRTSAPDRRKAAVRAGTPELYFEVAKIFGGFSFAG